mmetsp:Transcript_42961/g.84391  ORF Transcript_42961/g.84391 Transcript_42961/m.84391 type:complete len:215 (+) Transcript_42961:2542-3186(+)
MIYRHSHSAPVRSLDWNEPSGFCQSRPNPCQHHPDYLSFRPNRHLRSHCFRPRNYQHRQYHQHHQADLFFLSPALAGAIASVRGRRRMAVLAQPQAGQSSISSIPPAYPSSACSAQTRSQLPRVSGTSWGTRLLHKSPDPAGMSNLVRILPLVWRHRSSLPPMLLRATYFFPFPHRAHTSRHHTWGGGAGTSAHRPWQTRPCITSERAGSEASA